MKKKYFRKISSFTVSLLLLVSGLSLVVSAAGSYTMSTPKFTDLQNALNNSDYDEVIVPSGVIINYTDEKDITVPAG